MIFDLHQKKSLCLRPAFASAAALRYESDWILKNENRDGACASVEGLLNAWREYGAP